MSVVFHAINGSGLGHLMRSWAVIDAVRVRAPEAHLVLLTSAQSRTALASLDVPIVQLPPDEREPGFRLDRRLRTLPRATHDALVSAAVTALAPRVLVFDTHAPRAVLTSARGVGSRVLALWRPVKESALDAWLASTPASLVDEVLAACSRDEALGEMGERAVGRLEGALSVCWAGGMVRELPVDAARAAAIAARYGVTPDDALIVFASGAGGYAPVQTAFEARAGAIAARLHGRSPRVRCVFVRGPYHPGAPVDARRESALQIIDEEPELATLYARADLVVAHAGNNTVEEILRAGARAVLVPMERRAESQSARALRLGAAGRVELLELADDEATWSETVERALARPRPAPEQRRGAHVAAERVLAHRAAHRDERPGRARAVVHVGDDVARAIAEVRALADAHVTCALALSADPTHQAARLVDVVRQLMHGRAPIAALVALAPHVTPELAAALEAVRALAPPFVVDVTRPERPIVDVER